ncbi:VOC family protein [Halococcus dombrowskii]|uniref:VOC family protein n=1 Tax=Halococcus dombrowskii TaxID=179637 RepID=UPI0031D6A773
MALLCGDENELRQCTEFYCETLGFPLVTAWEYREDSNYGRTIENLNEVRLDDIKGTHEIWMKAGTTLLGLWLPRNQPENAARPPSEWTDVWDEGGEHVHYAFEVREAEFGRFVDELNRRGVDFKSVTHDEYGGAQSVFTTDPAGHVLEFTQERLRTEVEAEMPDPQWE